MKTNNMRTALICGMLGCLCYGGGDWLMMYGNPTYHGTLSWLTEGVAAIPQWRFNLAMALAFPGIILYGIALFAVQEFIAGEKQRKVYHYLNAFGLTPWIALHLFYIMILTLFAWLNRNGFAGDATAIGARQRGTDAAGVRLLVLGADQWKDGFSEVDGLYECADHLRHIEGRLPADAGERVQAGLYKWLDE